jgi:hypothetical protein
MSMRKKKPSDHTQVFLDDQRCLLTDDQFQAISRLSLHSAQSLPLQSPPWWGALSSILSAKPLRLRALGNGQSPVPDDSYMLTNIYKSEGESEVQGLVLL